MCVCATCVDSIHFIEALTSINEMHRLLYRVRGFRAIPVAGPDDGSKYERDIIYSSYVALVCRRQVIHSYGA